MVNRKRTLIFWGPFVLCVITIFLLTCVINFSSVPKVVEMPIPIDKIVHFGMFFTLSFLFLFAVVGHNSTRISLFMLLCIGIAIPSMYGGVIELIQLEFVEGRSGEWFDFLADMLGSVAGTLLFAAIQKQLIEKINKMLP